MKRGNADRLSRFKRGKNRGTQMAVHFKGGQDPLEITKKKKNIVIQEKTTITHARSLYCLFSAH